LLKKSAIFAKWTNGTAVVNDPGVQAVDEPDAAAERQDKKS